MEISGFQVGLLKLRCQRTAAGHRKLRNLLFSSNKVSKFAGKAVDSALGQTTAFSPDLGRKAVLRPRSVLRLFEKMTAAIFIDRR